MRSLGRTRLDAEHDRRPPTSTAWCGAPDPVPLRRWPVLPPGCRGPVRRARCHSPGLWAARWGRLAGGGGRPSAEYGGEEIERRLADMDWVSDRAMAHEKVVEHFAAGGPVVPMKLFTLFAGDERAVAGLGDRREALGGHPGADRRPRRVGRARPSSRSPAPATARRLGRRGGAASSGTGFLLRKKRRAGGPARAGAGGAGERRERLRGALAAMPPRRGAADGRRMPGVPAAARRRLPGAGRPGRASSRRAVRAAAVELAEHGLRGHPDRPLAALQLRRGGPVSPRQPEDGSRPLELLEAPTAPCSTSSTTCSTRAWW